MPSTDPARVRGRIDPEVRAGLDRVLAIVGPGGLSGIADIPTRRRRQAELKAMRGAAPLPEHVEVRDHVVPAGDGHPPVLVRSYAPPVVTPAPGIVYVHGGGLVLGSVAEDDGRVAELAVATGCIVTSIEYRLAPELPFPAALDDCDRALRWVVEHHDELGVDVDRVALYGPSAGGGLCAALALRARDRGDPPIALLVLVSPMLDDRCTEPSTFTNTGFGAWSREANLQAWSAYLGDAAGTDRVAPDAAPARATDLAGLPPTFVDVGDLDIFRDEAVRFAARLLRSDVPVELHVHRGAVHGGEQLAPGAGLSERMRRLRYDAIRRALC